jgi:apolipoprotein N-acyltransferase
VVSGAALGLSFQPYGLWPLLLIALPAFTLIVRSQRPHGVGLRGAFGLGYLFGLGLLVVAISWLHVLGVWVAGLLIAFESLFFGLLAVAISLVSRYRAWPLAVACCWALVEFAYARIPFGGFGWTRIAYAAVDTPLAGLLPVVGVAGLSFAVALIGQLVAWGVLAYSGRARHRPRRTWRPLALASAGVVAMIAVGGALTRYQVDDLAGDGPAVQVGIVQGNVPGRGIEALGRARSVTNNHLSETVDLMTRARLGEVPRPDFVLWPENSTDIDPGRDGRTRTTVQAAAEIADLPILVGAVTQGPGPDERQTTALWWDPQSGPVATYHKRNLVPFGEWIPFRSQLLPLVPVLAQVGSQSIPGTEPGVLEVSAGGRPLRVGDVICFELAYDQTVYQTVTGGAQLLMVQSNNATYGGTGQIEQQFAITRARAMEARREIAVATTNSVSGFVDRDGRVVQRTTEFSADSLVAAMPPRSALTPAVRWAPSLERVLAGVGLLLVAGAVVGRVRARRAAEPAVETVGLGDYELDPPRTKETV